MIKDDIDNILMSYNLQYCRSFLFYFHNIIHYYSARVLPQFSEVPRDWGNSFVISRVRCIEHFYLRIFSGKIPKFSLYRLKVNNQITKPSISGFGKLM